MSRQLFTSFSTDGEHILKFTEAPDESLTKAGEPFQTGFHWQGTSDSGNLAYSQDGRSLYILDKDKNRLIKYTLSESYKFEKITGFLTYDLSSYDPLYFSLFSAGVIILSKTGVLYSLTYDSSLDSYSNTSSLDVSGITPNYELVKISDGGTRLFIGYRPSSNYLLAQFKLGTPFEVNSAIFSLNQSLAFNSVKDAYFADGGQKIYLIYPSSAEVRHFNLIGGAWEIGSGFSFVSDFNITGRNYDYLWINPDGFELQFINNSYSFLSRATSDEEFNFNGANINLDTGLFLDISNRNFNKSQILSDKSLLLTGGESFFINFYDPDINVRIRDPLFIPELIPSIEIEEVLLGVFDKDEVFLFLLIKDINDNYILYKFDFATQSILSSVFLPVEFTPLDLSFSSDGLNLFLLAQGTPNFIQSFSFSLPFDLPSLSDDLFSLPLLEFPSANSLYLGDLDDILYVADTSQSGEYYLKRPSDLSSYFYSGISFDFSIFLNQLETFTVSRNFDTVYLFYDESNYAISSLKNAWDLGNLLEKDEINPSINSPVQNRNYFKSLDFSTILFKHETPTVVRTVNPDNLREGFLSEVKYGNVHNALSNLVTIGYYSYNRGFFLNKWEVNADLGSGVQTYPPGTICMELYEEEDTNALYLFRYTLSNPYNFSETFISNIEYIDFSSFLSGLPQTFSESLSIYEGDDQSFYLDYYGVLYKVNFNSSWQPSSISLSSDSLSSLIPDEIDRFNFFDKGRQLYIKGKGSDHIYLKLLSPFDLGGMVNLNQTVYQGVPTIFFTNEIGTEVISIPFFRGSPFIYLETGKKGVFLEDLTPTSPPINFEPDELFLNKEKNRLYAKSRNGSVSLYDLETRAWTHLLNPPINSLEKISDFDQSDETGYYYDPSPTIAKIYTHSPLSFTDLETEGDYLSLNDQTIFANNYLEKLTYTPFPRGIGNFITNNLIETDGYWNELYFFAQFEDAEKGLSGKIPLETAKEDNGLEDLDIGGGYTALAFPSLSSPLVDQGEPIFELLYDLGLTSDSLFKAVYLDISGNVREEVLNDPLDLGAIDLRGINQFSILEPLTLEEFLDANGSPSSSYVSVAFDQLGNSNFFQTVSDSQPQFSNYDPVSGEHSLFEKGRSLVGLKFDGVDDFLYFNNFEDHLNLENLTCFTTFELSQPSSSVPQPIFSFGYNLQFVGFENSKSLIFNADDGVTPVTENLLTGIDITSSNLISTLFQASLVSGDINLVANSSETAIGMTPTILTLGSDYLGTTFPKVGTDGTEFFEGVIYEICFGGNALSEADTKSLITLNNAFISQSPLP